MAPPVHTHAVWCVPVRRVSYHLSLEPASKPASRCKHVRESAKCMDAHTPARTRSQRVVAACSGAYRFMIIQVS